MLTVPTFPSRIAKCGGNSFLGPDPDLCPNRRVVFHQRETQTFSNHAGRANGVILFLSAAKMWKHPSETIQPPLHVEVDGDAKTQTPGQCAGVIQRVSGPGPHLQQKQTETEAEPSNENSHLTLRIKETCSLPRFPLRPAVH